MAKKKNPLPLKSCPGCEVAFRPKRTNQAYCNPGCGTRHWMKRHPRSAKPVWTGRRKPEDPMKRQWRRVVSELKSLGYERAREVVRLAVADMALRAVEQ